jgi:hypothetical protein
MKIRRSLAAMGGLMLVLASHDALAHHSFAMFDMKKEITLKGTVRIVEWTNPHTWLWVDVTSIDGKPVTGKDGKPAIWGLEGAAPGELTRQGFKRSLLKAGTSVSVKSHWLKDGRDGGNLGQITLADGTVLGAAPTAPGAPSPAGGAPPAAGAKPAGAKY